MKISDQHPEWSRDGLLHLTSSNTVPHAAVEQDRLVHWVTGLTSWHLTPKPEARPLMVLAADPPALVVYSLTSAACA